MDYFLCTNLSRFIPGQEISVEFHYFPRISVELYGNLQKPKELCGKKQRHRNEFISVRKSCGKARKSAET